MTREEQIERVAKMLCAARWEAASRFARWDRLDEKDRDVWRQWAERIVEALAQPVALETEP